MRIVIAPYAARLPNDRPNAKNYPWWPELIRRLMAGGHDIVQLGGRGETRIDGVGQFICNWPLSKLVQVIRDADTWIAVDTWLSHFCYVERLQPGFVLFSQSDPEIWGHHQNVNLLKSRAFVREYQYAPWFDVPFNPDAFVSPEEVVRAINERLMVAKAA